MTRPRVDFHRPSLGLALTLLLGFAASTMARPSDPVSGPDPGEIPVPPIKTAMGTLPGVYELPTRPEMPDVMMMNDGTRVTTIAQWQPRREELLRILEYYAIGQMPLLPQPIRPLANQSDVAADATPCLRTPINPARRPADR